MEGVQGFVLTIGSGLKYVFHILTHSYPSTHHQPYSEKADKASTASYQKILHTQGKPYIRSDQRKHSKWC